MHSVQRVEKDGWVYFAQAAGSDGHPIKIGWSNNPWATVREAHRWAWFSIEVISTIAVPRGCLLWGTGRDSLERILHTALQRHRVRGEWFSPVKDVIAFVKSGLLEFDRYAIAKGAVSMMEPGYDRTYWEQQLKRSA
jgi:hypothetical protein